MTTSSDETNKVWQVNTQTQALNITYMEASKEFIVTSKGELGAQNFVKELHLELVDVEQLPKLFFSLNSLYGLIIRSVSIAFNSGELKIVPIDGCGSGKCSDTYLPNKNGVVVVEIDILEMPKKGDSFDFTMQCKKPDGNTVHFDPKVIIGKPRL